MSEVNNPGHSSSDYDLESANGGRFDVVAAINHLLVPFPTAVSHYEATVRQVETDKSNLNLKRDGSQKLSVADGKKYYESKHQKEFGWVDNALKSNDSIL